MDLAAVADGASAVVVAVDLDPAARLRLGEVGVRPGAVVRVTGHGPAGARVLAIGADRLAIDRSTCARVTVTALAQAQVVSDAPLRRSRFAGARSR